MLFNSLEFIFFFIVVTISFFTLPHKLRWLLLLAASCFFYMFFVPIYILILAGTILIDYFAGIFIERAQNKKKLFYLVLSLIANIGVLAVFKYYNFFVDNINSAQHFISVPYLSILLPIGLSFHTFQAMSYTIEVFRGNQKAEQHFGIYALYVMFYPQLVAGPIERPQNILHQFYEFKKPDYNNFIIGFSQMIRGFFKKVVVADLLAGYVDNIYNNYQSNTGFTLVFASWMFVIQLYCDFSGYSDIAIGAARIMGFKLMTNFKLPLFSKTLSEFWNRWHISLSSWLRDYLFYPLLISKRDWGKWALIYATLITFLISGFWHGAGWNFIVFGLLHGVILCMEILLGIKSTLFSKTIFKKALGVFITFNLLAFTLIFFRAKDVFKAFEILKSIFTLKYFFNLKINDTGIFASMLFGVFVLLSLEYFIFRKHSIQNIENKKPKWLFGLNVLFVILILLFGVSNGEQFIYFQF